MIEIRQTEVFSKWLRGLRDRQARVRIQTRIDRLQLGLAGDVKPIGEGYQNCGSITARDIESISYGAGGS